MKFKTFILTMMMCHLSNAFASEQPIIRKPLLTAMLTTKCVDRVEIKEINFTPLQRTGLHKHPIPVVGYIAEGAILFQVEGESSKVLHPGDVFYEPANTKIIHFDNASKNLNAKFIAFYLLNKNDHELIHAL